MKKAAHPTSSHDATEPAFLVLSVGAQLLDTTWRLAVPVLLLAIGGIAIDKRFGTKPWVTVVLALVGFGIGGWLVKKQIDAVNRSEQ